MFLLFGIGYKTGLLFSVKTLLLPKRVEAGKTVALEFTLVRREYTKRQAILRYFKPDGKGVLTDDTGKKLVMNRLYRIKSDEFTLLYQSTCSEAQQLDFVFMDNFGQETEYAIAFQNANKE